MFSGIPPPTDDQRGACFMGVLRPGRFLHHWFIATSSDMVGRVASKSRWRGIIYANNYQYTGKLLKYKNNGYGGSLLADGLIHFISQ